MRIEKNRICVKGIEALIGAEYNFGDGWKRLPADCFGSTTGEAETHAFEAELEAAHISWKFTEEAACVSCDLTVCSPAPVVVRLLLSLPGEERGFHLIPCNIYGDNNEALAHAGEFPLLTDRTGEDIFRSSFWAFRADRAATPVSMVCGRDAALGVAVDVCAEKAGSDAGEADAREGNDGRLGEYLPTPRPEILHNGLYSCLPGTCGASIGYVNEPFTFRNKRTADPSEAQGVCSAKTRFRLYFLTPGQEAGESTRPLVHRIIRSEYALIHDRAEYKKRIREAVYACLKAFTSVNWDGTAGEYTNRECLPPERTALKPWRRVVEIGWTGGGVLAYPLIAARELLGAEADALFAETGARTGEGMIERILASYNEKSGLLNDLTDAIDDSGSRLNGWWTGFGLVKDCHCAYNVGSAVHYVLKSAEFLRKKRRPVPEEWIGICRKVCDTVVSLQREDGAFGYTFSPERREVLDWDGFAGCWFVPCLAYLCRLTGEEKYLSSAKKGIRFYEKAVRSLTPSGTPMDTWKSTDEEGNLAFIRGARLLYEETKEEEFLEDLKAGAEYEFLWRYAGRTYPDYRPILEGWTPCGGSVTSVSNPHIHPMGMIVDSDLYYLAKVTGDPYYAERAKDGTAWLMQTLELYPEKTGYGEYGVLSERWCPGDGLTIQRDSDGKPYSSWFSYNLWAAAAVFEEACERLMEGEG